MHDVEAAGLQRLGAPAAAVHIDELDLQSLRRIEARGLRGPPCQLSVGWIGDSGAKRNGLGGAGGSLPADERQNSCKDGSKGMPAIRFANSIGHGVSPQ